MANEQPAGPIDHLVPVQCDLASSTLELTVTTLRVKPGDRVIWQFFDLAEGWSPWIEFQPHTDFLGPFTSLTQSGTAVWGTISEEQALNTSLDYRAMAQKGQGTAWETGAASIHSSKGSLQFPPAGEEGTTQRFSVIRNGDALSVSPFEVQITAADTVEWDFATLDEVVTPGLDAWRPMVVFHSYDGKGAIEDLYLGPFTSLTTTSRTVRGMGNNHVTGLYFFQVAAVRVSDGAVIWISSPDPAIDNRGGVTDPPGGNVTR